MNQNANSFTLDVSSNLQNVTLQEILNKILVLSKGQSSNTALLKVGNEMISLNITKISSQSQEHIPASSNDSPNNDNNINNSDSKKIETLENSDSLVRHISDKDETKPFLQFSNNIPHISKCETFPLNEKPYLRPDQRHFSLDALLKGQPQSKEEKPWILVKSSSQKVLRFNELNPLVLHSALNEKRRYSNPNDLDFSLSISKDSISARRLDSKLQMTKGDSSITFNKDSSRNFHKKETSLNFFAQNSLPINERSNEPSPKLHEEGFTNKNEQMPYAREISLNFSKEKEAPLALKNKNSSNYFGVSLNLLGSLSMSKGLSSAKYKVSSDEIDVDRKKNQDHESFNTLDFNVSKSESKEGSPIKKGLMENFITIENQGVDNEDRAKKLNMKSEEVSGNIASDMDIDKIEISRSLYIMENSYTEKKNAENNHEFGEKRFPSPLGISKRNEGSTTNTRYVPQKNLIDSKSFSNISESVESALKKSGEEDYLAAIQTIEELMKKTDQNSKIYQDLRKTLEVLGRFNEKIVAKEMLLSNKEMELVTIERSLREKEKKINELLEKTSKSSTQWSLDNMSNGNNTKDPLKELLEEQMSESCKPKAFSIPSDSKIHFLFLYSSPLITYFKDSEGKVGKRQIFNEIDYLTELKQVQDILISSHKEIKFLSVPASLERLSLSLDKNPLALHFCGHGVRNNEETFGIGYDQNEGDFLILEDEMGGAYFLSSKNLENLLKKLKNQLYFVFVASCHSKIVGEVFLKAGALHVVCVKREERILDIACQVFSKAFYHACLTGEQTICQAFEIAKKQVRMHEGMPPGEENKFVLLVKEEDDIYSDHTCFGWVDGGPGSFIDMNEKAEFNELPSKIENFMGRNEVMHDLIHLVLTSRLVTLKGIAGIGKSSLVKETVRYVSERKHFRNGIIYLNLNCCETKEAVTSCLMARILGGNSRYIESNKEYRGRMVHQIVEELRNKEVLIVFDNIMEIMLINERENFHVFLDLLLSNCNDVKVLSTSRSSLGEGHLADYAEKIINLGPLSDEDSKNLLLARAPRVIGTEEIDDLLNMEIAGNFGLPLENKKDFVGHAFFDLFGGHPQAITLAASLLDEKVLKEVFLHLKENSVINAFDYSSDMSERDKKGFNSLKGSLDVSFESLMKKNTSAGMLLTFLGLFPAGIQEEDLAVLWDKNFKSDCEVLLKSSLLRKTQKENTTHYSLFPFMAKYAEERLNYKDKKDYHDKIMNHFAEKIEGFYKVVGTISKDAEKQVNILIRYELNIRACIFREIAYQGNEDLEKSLYDSFNLNTSNIRINERFKDIEAIKEDEEDDFPLTKPNIEMHQKRFEANKTSLKHNQSLSGNSLRSSSPIYITENMANQLKTPKSRMADHLSLSDPFFKFNFGNLSQSGAASASLENSNNILDYENPVRNSITPEPEVDKDVFKKLRQIARADVSLNNEQINSLEKLGQAKETPKFNKEGFNKEGSDEKDKLRDIIESPQILEETNDNIVINSNTNSNDTKQHKKNINKVKINVTASFDNKGSTLKIPNPVKPINDISARISQNSSSWINNSQGGLNNSQEMFSNLKIGSKEHIIKDPYRWRSGNYKRSPSHNQQGQFLPINKLIIYYSSILFLLRRYGECIKMLKYGLRIARNNSDTLAEANYYRINGVVSHLRKQSGKSVDEFSHAKELFQRVDCSLGVAICEAALGYIKFSENCGLFLAKDHLEHSLKIYENLEHSFGIHFLNRWLGGVKRKIPHLKQEAKQHFQKAHKIMQIKKDECLLSYHKGGFFVLRWMGDPISLFLEAPLTVQNSGDNFKKKTQDISDNEIKSLAKKMKIKLDSSYEIENNSGGLDDSSNKTPGNIKMQYNFNEQEEEFYSNHSKNTVVKDGKNQKPPQMPKLLHSIGRKSLPSHQNNEKK